MATHVHLAQLALDPFEEGMLPAALALVPELVAHRLAPIPELVQIVTAIALCDPARARLRAAHQRAVRAHAAHAAAASASTSSMPAGPTEADIALALEALSVWASAFPSHVVQALPPFASGADDVRAPGANARMSSSSSSSLRTWRRKVLYGARDLFALRGDEEFWMCALDARPHKRQLEQDAAGRDGAGPGALDPDAGFWNLLGVLAPIYTEQGRRARRWMSGRTPCHSPPGSWLTGAPFGAESLAWLAQATRATPAPLPWRAPAANLSSMLSALGAGIAARDDPEPTVLNFGRATAYLDATGSTSGRNPAHTHSSPKPRPPDGPGDGPGAVLVLPPRQDTALALLKETLFLTEANLLSPLAVQNWLATCFAPADMAKGKGRSHMRGMNRVSQDNGHWSWNQNGTRTEAFVPGPLWSTHEMRALSSVLATLAAELHQEQLLVHRSVHLALAQALPRCVPPAVARVVEASGLSIAGLLPSCEMQVGDGRRQRRFSGRASPLEAPLQDRCTALAQAGQPSDALVGGMLSAPARALTRAKGTSRVQQAMAPLRGWPLEQSAHKDQSGSAQDDQTDEEEEEEEEDMLLLQAGEAQEIVDALWGDLFTVPLSAATRKRIRRDTPSPVGGRRRSLRSRDAPPPRAASMMEASAVQARAALASVAEAWSRAVLHVSSVRAALLRTALCAMRSEQVARPLELGGAFAVLHAQAVPVLAAWRRMSQRIGEARSSAAGEGAHRCPLDVCDVLLFGRHAKRARVQIVRRVASGSGASSDSSSGSDSNSDSNSDLASATPEEAPQESGDQSEAEAEVAARAGLRVLAMAEQGVVAATQEMCILAAQSRMAAEMNSNR